jgi:hypothetical protein
MDRQNLFCHLGVVVVLLTACAALAFRPRRWWFVRLIAVGGILLSLFWSWSTYEIPYDFKRFWQVGRDISGGVDYYGLNPRGDRQLILNPPTVVPLFRAWALLPLRKSARLWVGLNAVGVLGLVPLAYVALRARMGPDAPRLPRPLLAILSAALALSCSHIMGLALGQVSVLMAAALFAAVLLQARGRPGLAGLALAVATVKINTMLPFLALFLRKRDWPAWVGLGLGCLVLAFLSGSSPGEWPRQLAKTAETIHVTYQPGQVNDYGYAGPSHASLVGIDHALYRVGLRDRAWISRIQMGILAVLGVALVGGIRSGRVGQGTDCALVALYASLFLYHRTYDMVLLVLPMVLAALNSERASTEQGCRLTVRAAITLLLVPFVNPDGLKVLERWSLEGRSWTGLLQATALPASTWLVLLGGAGLIACMVVSSTTSQITVRGRLS